MTEMPTLYLRDVPDSLVERLRRRARRNRRSMSAEAVAILQRAVDDERDDVSLVRRLRQLRYAVPDGEPSDVELIRQGRDELDRRHRR
jgi:antitoxin FitA